MCPVFPATIQKSSNCLSMSHLSLDVNQASVLGEEPSEGVQQQLRLHADVDLHRLAGGLHPGTLGGCLKMFTCIAHWMRKYVLYSKGHAYGPIVFGQ